MINGMEQLNLAGTIASGTSRGLTDSIASAAQNSGIDFDYLLQTAVRESGLDSKAKASTSSATGAFQFIEQTWLSMIKHHGADYGLAQEANAIHTTRTGRHIVPDEAQRTAILALREDPAISSAMAAELTADNKARMENALNRPVNDGELYMAHFLGISGAIRFIEHAADTPNAIASQLFPREAEANPGIFRDGRTQHERSMQQVLDALVAGFDPQVRNTGRSPSPVSGNQTAARGREPQLSTATPSSNGMSINSGPYAAGFHGMLGNMVSMANTGSMNALSPETFAALLSLDVASSLTSPISGIA